jgi:hypothetical protein
VLELVLCVSSLSVGLALDGSGTAGVSRLGCTRAEGGDCLSKSGNSDSSRNSERDSMVSPLRSRRTMYVPGSWPSPTRMPGVARSAGLEARSWSRT